jgi:hypothetical protein
MFCDLPCPRTTPRRPAAAAAFERHACLPSVGWPLPSTKDISSYCVPEVACCTVSPRLLSCLLHPLPPLSTCIQSSQSTILIRTRTASPANTNETSNATASLCTVHAPRQTLAIPRPSYPARLVLLQAWCDFIRSSTIHALLAHQFNPRLLRNSVGLLNRLDLEITAAAASHLDSSA